MPEYKLPDVGEGLTEAEIVSWKVEVGDVVKVNDVVVEIETAKSIVELPSPYAGPVTAILVAEGETVPVGTPIIAIGEPSPTNGQGSGDEPAGLADRTGTVGDPIDTNIPPEGQATLVGYGPKESVLKRRPRRFATPEIATRAQAQASFIPGAASPLAEAEDVPARDVRVLAKPPVRKLAKDLGVDLATITGSGPEGTVTRQDVEAAAPRTSTARTPNPASSTPEVRPFAGSGERETREPIKGVRKMMAAAMVESAFTAPHVTEWVTVDATATVELVERLKKRPELRDVKVSPLLVVARASILALRRSPLVNSTWDEAAGEVVVKHYVNLGIAAATPRGLVVPNVKDAQALDLAGLASELEQLTATAKAGRTQPADTAGGTFTITNVGVFGVDGGTPIINPGVGDPVHGRDQAAAVGGGRRRRAAPGDDAVAVVRPPPHRRRHGSRFLADVAGMVHDPATSMLF